MTTATKDKAIGADVRARLEEQLHDLRASFLGRDAQWREPAVVRGVHHRTSLEEHLCHLFIWLGICTLSNHHKWSLALTVDLVHNVLILDEAKEDSEIVDTTNGLIDWSRPLL